MSANNYGKIVHCPGGFRLENWDADEPRFRGVLLSGKVFATQQELIDYLEKLEKEDDFENPYLEYGYLECCCQDCRNNLKFSKNLLLVPNNSSNRNRI